MDARPGRRVALIAIQPRFAQAILSGDKRVELRKRRLAADIDTVLILREAPTQRIVGRFTIASTVEASPTDLWPEFGVAGGIPHGEFMAYYAGHVPGVGLVVETAERYQRPVALAELGASPTVPQSFAYLPASASEEILRLQAARPVLPLPSLLGRLLQAPGRILAGAGSR